MDVIILAAGENVRLQVAGLAPGRKPLLMREGEVLIRRLCRQARENPCDRIVIVASPRNVEDIVFATKDFNPMYVVQPDAAGPQAAFRLGLELTRDDRVMLLMGDNFIPRWRENHGAYPSASVTLCGDEALHPLTDDGFFIEPHAGECARWLGPLTVRVDMLDLEAPWPDWVTAFDNIAFDLVIGEGVEDMGVLK